jgi:cyclophilin family peptidyl-prolyl cis-trans isomerase
MKNFFLYFLFLALLIGCKESSSNQKSSQNSSTQKENTLNSDSTQTPDSTASVEPKAVIQTNMGTIELQLFPDKAPQAVENFIGLARKGYYNGVTFHRVIDKFMIQGGDPTATGMGGQSIWGKSFNDEIVPDLKFDSAGILAMANAGPNTNGSQFFITVAATPWLNGHYTIFGKVINGMDVVYAISKVPTSKPGDKPLKDVVMQKVTIEEAAK